MKNQKIQNLYSLLSDSERDYFKNWLKIEIGKGKQESVLPEFCYSFLDQKKEKSDVWQDIFPGEKFSQDLIYKLTNKLQTKLEEFLSLLSFRRSPAPNRNLHLLSFLLRRGNQEIFEKMKGKISNNLEKQPESIEKYRWQYELGIIEQEADLKYSANIRQRKEEELIYRFESWTKLEGLFLTQVNRNLKKAIKNEHVGSEGPERLHPKRDDGLLYKILMQLNELLEESIAPEEAFTFFDELKENIHLLSPKMQAYVYGITSNFLVRSSNQNKSKALLIYLWDWYEWGIEARVLKFKGQMLSNHLKNMMVLANLLESEEKIQTIKKNIVDRLPPELQSETIWIAQILYEQRMGDFKSILAHSPPKIFRNIHFELNWRAIELQARYEKFESAKTILEDEDKLESRLKSFKTYLQRHKSDISNTHYQAYMNFCLFMTRLINLMPVQMQLEKSRELSKKIDESQLLFGKTWLSSKL